MAGWMMVDFWLLVIVSFWLSGCQESPVRPSTSPQEKWLNPSARSANNTELVLSEWWETVDLENQDRKNRLKRLANLMPGVEPPQFYQYNILKHLVELPVDIPVLRVVFSERVFFDTAESRIRPEARPVINLVAESLRLEPPDVAVFVAGHTDSRGSEDYNYNLSVDRANSVAKALSNRGIGRTAIWRIGFGEAVPLRRNETPEAMAMNRRVEFLFAGKAKAAAIWLARQIENPCPGTTIEDTKHCKRKLTLRSEFQAVPILKDNTKTIPTSHGKKVDVTEPINTRVPVARHGSVVDIQPNDRITIDLDDDTFRIPAPEI